MAEVVKHGEVRVSSCFFIGKYHWMVKGGKRTRSGTNTASSKVSLCFFLCWLWLRECIMRLRSGFRCIIPPLCLILLGSRSSFFFPCIFLSSENAKLLPAIL